MTFFDIVRLARAARQQGLDAQAAYDRLARSCRSNIQTVRAAVHLAFA